MEFPDYQWYDDLTRVFGFDVYKNFIATSNSDGGMRMFNAATGKRVPFGGNGNGWVGIEKPIRTLKFAPDLWDKYEFLPLLNPFCRIYSLECGTN